MNRVFLGWSAPLLDAAAEWLLRRADRTDGLVDLRGTCCIVPGRRAGRRLRRRLLASAGTLAIVPPRIVTPGELGPACLALEGTPASSTERLAAWMRAIKLCPRADLEAFMPERPPADDLMAWRGHASMIAAVHDELTGDGLTFTDAAGAARAMGFEEEGQRWETLTALELAYHQSLGEAGRCDRAEAIGAALARGDAGRLTGLREIVFIGVADLNARQRAMAAVWGAGASALVLAPPAWDDRFDADGCIRVDVPPRRIEIDDDRIIVASRPIDQAQAVWSSIAGLAAGRRADEITIGLADESLASAIDRAGRIAGARVHDAQGRGFERSPSARLVAALADWLEERSAAHLSALLRHPDLESVLPGADLVSGLDRVLAEANRLRIDGTIFDGTPHLQGSLEHLDGMLEPLTAGTKPLPEWGPIVRDLLRAIYDDEHTATDRVAELEAWRDLLDAVETTAPSLAPPADGVDALRWLLASGAPVRLAEDVGEDQVEMLGWLELMHDAAPVLVIAGLNEGAVPATTSGDAFLPDSIRSKLGLVDNARRAARDFYTLAAIIESGRNVVIVAGRCDGMNEPLAPSRLLLACDEDTLPRRVLRFTDDDDAYRATTWCGAAEPAARSRFVPPAPTAPPVRLTSMRVTAFREYLRCPYRFWLGHIERLRRGNIFDGELDAMAFGNVAHDVLEAFGKTTSVRDERDPEPIEGFLRAELDRQLARRCGADLPPAVMVQRQRLQERLHYVAQRQAQHRKAGWRIERSEYTLPVGTTLDVPGSEAMNLTGRIDRVDVHDETGAIMIIDYKTGDKGTAPDEAHRNRDGWIDLQLPLYEHLYRRDTGTKATVSLAYFLIPGNADGAEIARASWTDEQRAEAIEVARDVVRCIRAGTFPMHERVGRPEHDDYGAICQVGVYRQDAEATAS